MMGNIGRERRHLEVLPARPSEPAARPATVPKPSVPEPPRQPAPAR